MDTFLPKEGEIIKKWFVVDANGQVLGRLATKVATILRGKHKEVYTPFLDLGDHVIVLNAAKVRFTGNKLEKKMYRSYSGYPGGLKEKTARTRSAEHPERIVEDAILGMLPRGKLGRAMGKKLMVYADDKHPHQAQKPQILPLEKAK